MLNKKYKASWYLANRERVLLRVKAWQEANSEKCIRYAKKYAQSSKGKETRRKINQRRRLRSPEKLLAVKALNRAVASGQIVRQPCSVCNSLSLVEAHHEDYSKPFDVIWLCRQHHKERHRIVPEKSGAPN